MKKSNELKSIDLYSFYNSGGEFEVGVHLFLVRSKFDLFNQINQIFTELFFEIY